MPGPNLQPLIVDPEDDYFSEADAELFEDLVVETPTVTFAETHLPERLKRVASFTSTCLSDYEHLLEHIPAPVDTFWPCTLNLVKVILGATLLALPKAFSLLGIVLASSAYLLVFLLMTLTCKALVDAQDDTNQLSYGRAIGMLFGKAWKWVLYVSIFFNCFGNMVAYVVILGDLLVGTAPSYNGILQDLLGLLGLQPAATPWLDRKMVVAVLTVVLFIPLSSIRDMDRLNPMNMIGNAAVIIFSASLALLMWLSVQAGVAYPLTWEPDWVQLGGDTGGTLLVVLNIIAIVPVLINATVCHQSVFPAMRTLRPYSPFRMVLSLATALGLCTALFFVISLSARAVFGPGVDADVLNNMNVGALAPLMGHSAAHMLACTVRVCYSAALIGCFGLMMFPMRDTIEAQMRDEVVAERWFLPVSWVLVLAVVVVALSLESVWAVLMFSGATTSTVVAFAFPGALMVRQALLGQRPWAVATGLVGVLVLVLGGAMLTVGVMQSLTGASSG